MLQENTQEPNYSVSHRLTLLDTQNSEYTPDDFIVEFFLVKILLRLSFALLSARLARVWRFEAASLLYFPKIDH